MLPARGFGTELSYETLGRVNAAVDAADVGLQLGTTGWILPVVDQLYESVRLLRAVSR